MGSRVSFGLKGAAYFQHYSDTTQQCSAVSFKPLLAIDFWREDYFDTSKSEVGCFKRLGRADDSHQWQSCDGRTRRAVGFTSLLSEDNKARCEPNHLGRGLCRLKELIPIFSRLVELSKTFMPPAVASFRRRIFSAIYKDLHSRRKKIKNWCNAVAFRIISRDKVGRQKTKLLQHTLPHFRQDAELPTPLHSAQSSFTCNVLRYVTARSSCRETPAHSDDGSVPRRPCQEGCHPLIPATAIFARKLPVAHFRRRKEILTIKRSGLSVSADQYRLCWSVGMSDLSAI